VNKNIGITNVRLDLGAPRRGAAAAPTVIHDTGIVAALEALGHRVVAQHEILQDDVAGAGDDPRTAISAPSCPRARAWPIPSSCRCAPVGSR
jgi:hypothetical protein